MTNTIETENLCGLKSKDLQTITSGKNIDPHVLKDNVGNEVAITNYGGTIVVITIPDKEDKFISAVQGYDSIQDVVDSLKPYPSILTRRYGNRIAKGKFHLHGKEYHLPINNEPDCLHGGNKGLNACVWDALQVDDQTLTLKYVSPYSEEGFSGELRTAAMCSFNDDNELLIKHMSTTNKKTTINLTSHGFFSLLGITNPTPTTENQICEINTDYYVPIDDTSIPADEIRSVEGTSFDLRQSKPIDQGIKTDDMQTKNGAGCNCYFVLNKKEESEPGSVARLTDPTSCRTMEVCVTEPGVQLYTDNWADDYKGRHGTTFPRHSTACLEVQHFPNSPSHLYSPSVILKPNQEYKQKAVYKSCMQR